MNLPSAGRHPPLALGALAGRTILITGANGMLGTAFAGLLRRQQFGLKLHALGRDQLDVTDAKSVALAAALEPDLIVHCAALVDMDRCEREPGHCRRSIVEGTAHVAELARRTGAQLVYPQSFLVYGASAETPLAEDAPPVPRSEYGRAKLEAEQLVRADCPQALVIRMGGFFGGEERDKNFVGSFSRRLATRVAAGGEPIEVGDRVWQPSFTEDLAANSLLLVAHNRVGVYHMAAHGEASFFEVASQIVAALGLASQVQLVARPASEFAARESGLRPLRLVIDNARLRAEGLDHQRPWRDALAEYLSRPYFQALARSATAAGAPRC